MRKYIDFIEQSHLVEDIESTTTTGDLDYPGTALEVWESGGEELLHIVVDSKGQRQVLFLAHEQHYRLTLSALARIIASAEEDVHSVMDHEDWTT